MTQVYFMFCLLYTFVMFLVNRAVLSFSFLETKRVVGNRSGFPYSE